MRILYDATPLLMRSAGVKNYHYELLKRLPAAAAAHRFRLFPFLSGLPQNDNERSNYPFLSTWFGLGCVLASNYLKAPFAAAAARGADVFHVTPHLFDPPSGPALTAAIHDPTPLLMPQCHTATTVRYFERFATRALPRLAGAIAPSEAVKADLVVHCGADADKVCVIPHGVAPDFFNASQDRKQAVRRAYALPRRFLLAVGSIEPRKNLERLIAAYGGLPAALRRRVHLVLAGPRGWRDEAIRRRIEQTRGVRAIGYVSRPLLPALYAAAAAFVFPSLYEGFGLPLLEAMAAGTPVIASDRAAMPEVVGEAGLSVDPLDVDALRRALERILEDDLLAAKLASAGRRRARAFTWEKTVAATLEFLEVHGGRV